jgi:hypothetical protein
MLGGGSGHIFDMIARLKANQALRNKKSYFKTMQDYMNVTGGQKLSFREATQEELKAIREKKNRQQEMQKTIFARIITIILTTGLIWLLVIGIMMLFG